VLLVLFLHNTKAGGRKTRTENAGHRTNEISVKGNWRVIRGTKEHGSGESYIMRSLVICNPDPVLFG